MPPLDLHLGDVLRLRKEHPCGSFDFEVVRLGADIGLHCTRCGRRILLPRSTLERRIAQFVSRGATRELPTDLAPSSLRPPAPSEAGQSSPSPLGSPEPGSGSPGPTASEPGPPRSPASPDPMAPPDLRSRP